MNFDILGTDELTKTRAGKITTAHGVTETPVFMLVGTVGSVKGVHQRELKEDISADIILGSTYHLYLRPQMPMLEKAGGLHEFINWDRNILTDSGGYQVYSLTANRKVKEEGVKFKSHIDGSYRFFSPENVMEIEYSTGAGIMMAFDECIPYPREYGYAKRSMHLTHRWLDRCIAHLERVPPKYDYEQSLFPIVQGSVYKDLRIQSTEYIASEEADGNAIGGLSVGEPVEQMYEMTELVCDILSKDKPRYLMGVDTPINILENIALGVDMMDCVMSTCNARNGMLFTSKGIINIKNKRWEDDFSPLSPDGHTYVDIYCTKAYLRHLFAANEFLGKQVAFTRSLGFYLWLVREACRQIIAGTFSQWKTKMVNNMSSRL